MDKSLFDQILNTIEEQKADAETGMQMLIDAVHFAAEQKRSMQVLRQYHRLLTMFLQHAAQAEEAEENPFAILSKIPIRFAMLDED